MTSTPRRPDGDDRSAPGYDSDAVLTQTQTSYAWS